MQLMRNVPPRLLPNHPSPFDDVCPLTGAFFVCVFYVIIIMNTPLQLRNVRIRLQIGYIVDAINGPFVKCEPGNTITRIADAFNDATPSHPYVKMWQTIDEYYNANRWYELSDVELSEMWSTMLSVGIDDGDKHISGVDVMRAKQRWDDNLWTRYEHKRNGRRSVAYKILPMTIVGLFGISLPIPDA